MGTSLRSSTPPPAPAIASQTDSVTGDGQETSIGETVPTALNFDARNSASAGQPDTLASDMRQATSIEERATGEDQKTTKEESGSHNSYLPFLRLERSIAKSKLSSDSSAAPLASNSDVS